MFNITAHLTDNPPEATVVTGGLAAPGPHPLESDDVRFWRGDDEQLPEGVTATGGESVGEAVPDPNRCLPGPHPHESADIMDWGGRQTGLPKGVEPWNPEA